MADQPIERRNFLKGAGLAGTAVLTGSLAGRAEAQAPSPAATTAAPAAPAPAPPTPAPPEPPPLQALTPAEAAFLGAVYDTFIPADQLSPSGTDCGLVTYIDWQLAGAWGQGARFYRSGPFLQGKPEQGYQLPLTPREYFAAGIAAANEWSRRTYGKPFDQLAPADREAALKTLDSGKADFVDFDSKRFFETVYESAMEGFFADPMYGGNRDKVSWKLLNYPGLPATYATTAEQYRGKKIILPPQSIQDLS